MDPLIAPTLFLSTNTPWYSTVSGNGAGDNSARALILYNNSAPLPTFPKRVGYTQNDSPSNPRSDTLRLVGTELILAGNIGENGEQVVINPPPDTPRDPNNNELLDPLGSMPHYYEQISSSTDLLFSDFELRDGVNFVMGLVNVYEDQTWPATSTPNTPRYYRSTASNPIFLQYVPELSFSYFFGSSCQLSGGKLRMKLKEIGYPLNSSGVLAEPPSSSDSAGTTMTNPETVDGCGIVLGLLQRALRKQYEPFRFQPYRINVDSSPQYGTTPAHIRTKQKIDVKNGKYKYSQQFDLKINTRLWDKTRPLSKEAYIYPI